jgi:hypothetical protein
MSCEVKRITIDGVEYVRADSVSIPPKAGKRAVVVLDRGWIVAGDVEDVDGRIKITRAVHVRSWSSIGFDGMLADPLGEKVVIRPIPNGFDCRSDAELFRVTVHDDWGLQ